MILFCKSPIRNIHSNLSTIKRWVSTKNSDLTIMSYDIIWKYRCILYKDVLLH